MIPQGSPGHHPDAAPRGSVHRCHRRIMAGPDESSSTCRRSSWSCGCHRPSRGSLPASTRPRRWAEPAVGASPSACALLRRLDQPSSLRVFVRCTFCFTGLQTCANPGLPEPHESGLHPIPAGGAALRRFGPAPTGLSRLRIADSDDQQYVTRNTSGGRPMHDVP